MGLKYLGNKNILIIVNDIVTVKLISTILTKRSDMNVISSYVGTDALKILLLEDKKIDIVLLEHHLPEKNVNDILYAIRENKKFDNLPVVIISSDGMVKSKLQNMGANGFLLKPFSMDTFISEISVHFEDRKQA